MLKHFEPDGNDEVDVWSKHIQLYLVAYAEADDIYLRDRVRGQHGDERTQDVPFSLR
jgi:hypothetical protein